MPIEKPVKLEKHQKVNYPKNIYGITKGKQSTLILDQYPVHKDDLVQKDADTFNVKLFYVPTSVTATNQPLDVNVNGPLKMMGKMIANGIFLKDPFAKYTRINSIKARKEAKQKISKKIIINSFTLACKIK